MAFSFNAEKPRTVISWWSILDASLFVALTLSPLIVIVKAERLTRVGWDQAVCQVLFPVMDGVKPSENYHGNTSHWQLFTSKTLFGKRMISPFPRCNSCHIICNNYKQQLSSPSKFQQLPDNQKCDPLC